MFQGDKSAPSEKRTYCAPEQIVYKGARGSAPADSLSVRRIPAIRRGRMSSPALRLVEGSPMDKTKALDAALSQIERAFGKGSIMRLGKNKASIEVDTVSTGSLSLDIALGIGGLPRGRVVEIYGPESSGKTTLALHCIA